MDRPDARPSDPSTVVTYDPRWPELFQALGRRLRSEMGPLARRIDHIGSTAVPGLDAKPIIDIQVSVHALEPVEAYIGALARTGFVWKRENPERTKRYFREAPGQRRTHLHVRRAGSYSEQLALLFRDYLRADPEWAALYAAEKRRLAPLLARDRDAYVEGKAPFVWKTIQRADAWAQARGWEPGSSDL